MCGSRYGVGIPLFIGAATGNLIEAVAISGGALLVGLTDPGGPYRGRVRVMLITCVNVAICTFVGELAGQSPILLVALLAVASFGAGMFIALGVPAYFVALMAPVTITVSSNAPADAVHAFERAAFAFAGGLFAIALVLWCSGARTPACPSAGRSPGCTGHSPLGSGTRTPTTAGRSGRPRPQRARRSMRRPGLRPCRARPVEAFRVLVDEADRTYLDLVSLRIARQRLEPVDSVVSGRAVDVGRRAAAEALVAVAQALESGRWEADAGSIRDRLDDSIAALRDELRGRPRGR